MKKNEGRENMYIEGLLSNLSPKERAMFSRMADKIEMPPGYMKRASVHAGKQLDILKRQSYEDLAKLPERTEIKAPAQLSLVRFFILRKKLKNKNIEIGVEASYWQDGRMRFASTPNFVSKPNGDIVEDFVHDPED